MRVLINLCWLFATIIVVLSTVGVLHGVPDDPLHPTWPSVIRPGSVR